MKRRTSGRGTRFYGTLVKDWRPSVTPRSRGVLLYVNVWIPTKVPNRVRMTGILGLNGINPGKIGSLGKTIIEPEVPVSILASISIDS